MTDLPEDLKGTTIIFKGRRFWVAQEARSIPHDDDQYDLMIYDTVERYPIGSARRAENGTFECMTSCGQAWYEFEVARIQDLGRETDRMSRKLYKDLGGE